MVVEVKRVAVFCGSSSGTDEIFEEQAFLLGQKLAEENIELVFGGAKVGLMGAVANGALNANGKVIGVLPDFLQKTEVTHNDLTDLHIVKSMHERKMMMNDLSDGVITLPGGYGTLEEVFEMITWAQLGLHKKPIAILNVEGFYNPLIELLQKMVEKGFVRKENLEMLLIDEDIDKLISDMKNYTAPTVTKLITRETS